MPNTVGQHGRAIYFLDADGRPQREHYASAGAAQRRAAMLLIAANVLTIATQPAELPAPAWWMAALRPEGHPNLPQNLPIDAAQAVEVV